MASFTDTQPPKFNPYIQQQPVEAMVAVGMQKQKAYEEGVQKIQTQVDNIAGLDVVRDVDKAYLQSKLNQLGNNLRTVASGDFSNFQLVNSVSGMTKQLTRDEGIQNAVNSTAKYRKEIAAMEDAEKNGKGSVANRWVFGKDSSDWLNSSDVKQSFNTKYTPFVDVEKKWMETMKSLHSDLVEVDIPYERNNDGSINYSKTAAAMQRISKETVSADKIHAALKASLSPDELNQLNISGRYTYRGHAPEDLVAMSRSKYSTQLNANDKRIRELTGLANLASSKPDLKKKALDSIEAVKAQNVQLRESFDEESEYIMKNPEAAKGSIYKNEAMNTFATANAWEHKKENLMTNPVKIQENWEKDYGMTVSKFKLDIRKQNWTEKMDVQKATLDNLKYQASLKELELKYGYGADMTLSTYGGTNTNIKDPVYALHNEANDYTTAANAGIVDLKNKIPGTSVTQIQNALLQYQTGDPNDRAAANKIIPVHLRTTANRIIDAQKNANRVNKSIAETERDVNNHPEIKGTMDLINKKIANLPAIHIKDSNGKTHSFTQQDIAKYVSKRHSGIGETTAAAVKWAFGFSDKDNPKSTFFKGPVSKEEEFLANAIHKIPGVADKVGRYTDAVGADYKRIYARSQELMHENLLKKGSSYIPMETAIVFGSGEGDVTRRYWEQVASSAIAPYRDKLNEGGALGGSDILDEDDATKALKWISSEGKSNILFSRVYQGDKTFLQLKNKGEEVLIPLSSDLASQLPADKRNPSPFTRSVVKAQGLGNGYTNPTGEFKDSFFSHINMPRTTMKIGADLREDGDNPNLNYIDFKLNTPSGIIPLTIEVPLDRLDAINAIQGLDNRAIKDAYLNNPSISPELKKVISNL